MDLLSVFKTENQRELLINLLPGSIASWPFTYLVVHGLNYDVESVLSEWTIIPIILAFLFIGWGAGFLLTDIASNIEIRLEKIYFKIKTTATKESIDEPFSIKDNVFVLTRLLLGWILIIFNQWETLLGKFVQDRLTEKSVHEIHEEFYNRWDKYLAIRIPDKEPIIVKYYKGVLNRFRFELTLLAAIGVMLAGHLSIYLLSDSNKIDWTKTGAYLGILEMIATFLFIEAFKGVELLDQLRQEMIEACK